MNTFSNTYQAIDNESKYCAAMCDAWLAKKILGELSMDTDVKTYILVETSKLVEAGKMRDGIGKAITGRLLTTNILSEFVKYCENIMNQRKQK